MKKTSLALWGITGVVFATLAARAVKNRTSLSGPILQFQNLQSVLENQPCGNPMYTLILLDYDRQAATALKPFGLAESYQALAKEYVPTRLGFRNDLLKAISQRLTFLTSLQEFVNDNPPRPRSVAQFLRLTA